MIENIAISGIKTDVTKDLEKYVQKKIGKLDKHLKRQQRTEIRADVKLSESMSSKAGKKCTCEVILHIPGVRLTAAESTVNMFAAIDIVETKIKIQLRKYKASHGGDKQDHRGILRRFRRSRQQTEDQI